MRLSSPPAAALTASALLNAIASKLVSGFSVAVFTCSFNSDCKENSALLSSEVKSFAFVTSLLTFETASTSVFAACLNVSESPIPEP